MVSIPGVSVYEDLQLMSDEPNEVDAQDGMTSEEREAQAIQGLANAYSRMREEIGKVIIGQREIVDELLVAMFSRGHCLLVGVPGLAPTTGNEAGAIDALAHAATPEKGIDPHRAATAATNMTGTTIGGPDLTPENDAQGATIGIEVSAHL